jgi:DUF4097 and DUF4098 domain-containing protein YvlB
MTAIHSILVCCAAAWLPGVATAQAHPVMEPRPAAVAAAEPRAAWYQRYQDAKAGRPVTEEWSRAFQMGASGALELSNMAGDIVVTVGDGTEVTVHAVKRARAATEAEARQLLSEIDIEVTESAGRVEIRTRYPKKTHHSRAQVDYEVMVPAGTGVTLRSIAGRVRVSGVKGDVRAESVSGDVEISASQQVMRARSISGDVALTDAGSTDVLDASTVSGNLLLKHIKARAIEAQTVSGDVRLEGAASERAQVKSISGNLTFEGPLAHGGRYEFNSHSGEVRVVVRGGTGFQLAANTFSGKLRSEIPFTGPQAQPATHEAGGFPGQRQLRGTVGDGSALVVVQTFSGSAVVTQGAEKPAGGKDQKK